MLVHKGMFDLAFVEYKNAGHLKTVADILVMIGKAVAFNNAGFKSTYPVHQAKKLGGCSSTQAKSQVKLFPRIRYVIDWVQFVFAKKFIRNTGFCRHVYKHDPHPQVFQFGAFFCNVG